MELTMSKAIWSVFLDLSILSFLLVVGQLLRSRIKILQTLLIPPALIAGALAMLLGPRGYDLLPLSKSFGVYASVFIGIVFAATPIGDKPSKEQLSGPVVGGMFFNITGIAILQYAAGMLFAVYGLCKFYPELPEQFGLLMATGFYGGHGTAVAVGTELERLGIPNMIDLANTSATIGIVGGILIGMMIINWGTRKGYTHYVKNPQDLPIELRTGLIPLEKQKPGGKITISSICLDPLVFHLGIVLTAAALGYQTSIWFKTFTTYLGYAVSIPAFCLALLYGFIINIILNRTKGHEYVDRHTIARIQGTSTDLLMVAGIGSLNLGIVFEYAGPIMASCLLGFGVTWFWFLYAGRYSSQEDWFERNMMSWGHATGVVATGVLLQRVVDPDLKSRAIEDTGMADLFNRPILIALQVIPPIVMSIMPIMGGRIVAWSITGVIALLWIIAYVCKWWVPSRPYKVYKD